MKTSPTFSVVFITMNRHEELVDIISQIAVILPNGSEIILVDNHSEEAIRKANRESLRSIKALRIIENETNAGVSGGRNIGLAAATRDIVIELDDDAVLGSENMFETIAQTFDENPAVGILAFRIVNYYTRKINRIEYPFKNKNRNPLAPGFSATFIGCGHAFRREVLDCIGLYRDFSPWGSEEADYSLRALNHGYEIYYQPDLLVYHKKSPKGRIKDPVEFGAIALKNRLKMAALNLPWLCILPFCLIRFPHFVWKTGSLRVVPLAIRLFIADFSYIRKHRKVISFSTYCKALRRGGQVLF